jgi:tetratricopeptide (TPR) repeat protein
MMGQASADACLFFMPRFPFGTSLVLFSLCLGVAVSLAQSPNPSTASPSLLAQKGTHLAEAGRCTEALPILKRSASRVAENAIKLKAGLATVRCAMTTNNVDAALAALQWLSRDFPNDPDVLYVSTHAFSDLSTRAAQDLGRTAPQSYQAHELNAESLEVQGKWDQAQKEYETILQQNPSVPGIHFRLGRILLSKPNPGPEMADLAKKQFQEELKIDPNNAGAEYVLGELARESQQWEEAVAHFERAAKLDAAFGDAYLGLGQSLISTKKYSEAIQPLETAVKLEPQNPATHFNLATAYSRTGRKQDAEKEFAIHRQMTQKEPPQDSPQ